MVHFTVINKKSMKIPLSGTACGECQSSCQSACKTSCTVANQPCESEN